ncbi:hypothetical protein [Candidatus Protofrankia californiensis]|uniref:hypothetical protein n=1 Tax=Candidatus Protofrankia californiensis TaxID=1839754 RepID=UPI0010417C11|nr:hypothetical protein [Candidatus Protofrankia californiensis]
MSVSVGLSAGPGLVDDGRLADAGDQAGQPDPKVRARAQKRSFSADYKLAILAEYEVATSPGAKGAILRRERLYAAHIALWRRARDAGALAELSRPIGRPPADARDTELAELRAKNGRLERELAKAQLVIDVQGKLHALLETLSGSAPADNGVPVSSRRPSG